MIAKILLSAKSFSGVSYNERKNEQGRSELLAAENFHMAISNPTKGDYINYMEAICSSNPNVSNVQFHAVISCKGRENTPDELKCAAEEYIKKMGYGDNPYLIYFHSDTENNHVHIVSPRVNRQGEKISDKYERIRSQKIMNELQNINLQEKAIKDIERARTYLFSTTAQFKLLLENQGWGIQDKEGCINLIKSGLIQYSIDNKDIEYEVKNKQSYDLERMKQLTAILHKYSNNLNHIELKKIMAEKFGVDIIYHQSRGHAKPYGYSLIDHKGKAVYKGSEILELNKLLMDPAIMEKVTSCNDIVASILRNKQTMESFALELKKMGYTLSMDGKITIKGDRLHLIKLSPDLLKDLRYNSRLQEANRFKASSINEVAMLSRVFSVKEGDITVTDTKRDVSSYKELLQSLLFNSNDYAEDLKKRELVIMALNGEKFLIDNKNHVIISEKDLGMDISNRSNQSVIINTGSFDHDMIMNDPDAARGKNLIEIICDVLGGQNLNVQADKKRRKRGQQQN